mmetsp:Transcript_10948/g.21664  ORF Transcript_10948/g.21664 Transcript_10948/m.21664 type:complete len:1041 (-) Transcript_10948:21-3143(-)
MKTKEESNDRSRRRRRLRDEPDAAAAPPRCDRAPVGTATPRPRRRRRRLRTEPASRCFLLLLLATAGVRRTHASSALLPAASDRPPRDTSDDIFTLSPQTLARMVRFEAWREQLFLGTVEPVIRLLVGPLVDEETLARQRERRRLVAARGRTGASAWLPWRSGRTADADGASRRRLDLLPGYLTSKPSRDTSMSFATLAMLFSLLSCLLLVFLSCFYHNQKTSPLFISPRRHRLPKLVPPPLPVDGPFRWMSVIVLMSDEEIINRVGYDALIFLRFHRLALRCIIKMGLFSFLIILPLNFTGGESRGNSNVKEYMGKLFFTDFMKFTMANVSIRSPRLWVHCVAAYLLTGIVIRELLVEYNAFNNIRHRYLLSRESHLRTVLVTNIPRHMRAPSKITNYFRHVYPEAVKSVTVCQNLIRLEALVNKRKHVISKIEQELLQLCRTEKRKLVGLNILEKAAQIFCTTFLCQKFNCIDSAQERLAAAYEQLEEFNISIRSEMVRRRRVMRQLDRMEAGPGSSDIDYILANSFIGEHKPWGRPGENVTCHAAALPPSTGAPRNPDGTLAVPRPSFFEGTGAGGAAGNAAAAAIADLGDELSEVGGTASTAVEYAGGAYRRTGPDGAVGPVVVEIPTSALQKYSRMVRGKVVSSFVEDPRSAAARETLEKHTNEVCDKAFIVMRTFTASTIAIQSMHSSKPGAMQVQTAPEPRDILWENIYVSKGAKRTRRYLADIFVHMLIFFYVVPVALVSMVLSEQALVSFSPRLRQLDQASAFFASSIAMVQPLSLVAIQQILPPLFIQVFKAEGILSFSEVQMKVFSRYFLFQVINVFLVTAIAGSIFDTMAVIISRPELALEYLGGSLPKMASFFITYVTLKTFLGLGVELVRIMSLLQGSVRSLLCPYATLRQKRSVLLGMRAIDDPGWFPFHKILAQDMLVIVICVVFAVVAPLVLIPCALFCLFSRLLWTHHHLYVYESVFETGGMFWPKIFRRFVFGLIISQATIAGQLIVKNAKHEAYAVIALMGLTYGFLRSTRARYDDTCST